MGWATANEKTFTRLAQMGVDESGLGDRAGRPNKRFKIMGILRDALRQKSMEIVEEIPEKGLVKYAKPVGVIAGLVPTTNPALSPPPGMGIYALKAKNVVMFSPHPRAKKTSFETVQVMRVALKKRGSCHFHRYGSPQGIDNQGIFDLYGRISGAPRYNENQTGSDRPLDHWPGFVAGARSVSGSIFIVRTHRSP